MRTQYRVTPSCDSFHLPIPKAASMFPFTVCAFASRGRKNRKSRVRHLKIRGIFPPCAQITTRKAARVQRQRLESRGSDIPFGRVFHVLQSHRNAWATDLLVLY